MADTTQETAQLTAQETAQATANAMMRDDSATKMLGMEIVSVGPGTSEISMRVRPDMANGFGMVHGGLTFTLADTAFAYACNSYNRLTVAQSCDVDFTNAGQIGDVLTARCTERFLRGRSGIYDVEVTNQDGLLIAVFRGKSRTLGEKIDPNSPQTDTNPNL